MSASRHRAGPLLRRVRDRAATGKSGSTKVWAEEQSVLRQQFRYLELPADTTRSTIAVAFSTDGYVMPDSTLCSRAEAGVVSGKVLLLRLVANIRTASEVCDDSLYCSLSVGGTVIQLAVEISSCVSYRLGVRPTVLYRFCWYEAV